MELTSRASSQSHTRTKLVRPPIFEAIAQECAIILRAHIQGKGKKKLDLDLLHAALIQVCLAPLSANVLARLGLYRTVRTLAEMHCDNHIGEVANAVADEWQMLYGVTALTTPHEDES